MKIAANETFLFIESKGETGEFACLAINKPGKVIPCSRPGVSVVARGREYMTFACDGLLTPGQTEFLQSQRLISFLERTELGSDDRVIIYGNVAIAYSANPTHQSASVLMDALTEMLPTGQEPVALSDSKLWPRALHEVFPLAAKWAIEDDDERDSVLENATREALEDLVTTVIPRLEVIDACLADATIPTDVASELHAISQAALEARRLLGR